VREGVIDSHCAKDIESREFLAHQEILLPSDSSRSLSTYLKRNLVAGK
jgi:hypothetical protein